MMLKEKLDEIIRNHLHWLREDCEGWENMRADLTGAGLYRANLTGANLTGADLYGANLTRADLTEANLTEANLTGANLIVANLTGANLTGANLYGVDLYGANLIVADLTEANLTGADLTGADLYGANLTRADLTEANLTKANLTGADLTRANIELEQMDKFFPLVCPDYGSFVGWKKCRGDMIVKLEICENAKRSSAFSRKCRCSAAKVLEIQNNDGSNADTEFAVSLKDSSFVYKVGETVSVSDFDEDRRNECSTGIHFFITRQEAADYIL